MATLTPEAKQLLSKTVRELRARLLRDLGDEAERRYQLKLAPEKAKLSEEARKRRARLDGWLDERVRTVGAKNKKEEAVARERFLLDAVKEAAATVLNRLVLLRHLEALGLSRPAVVVGGWNSAGYREFREFAPALTGQEGGDGTEGYGTLLGWIFDELALDMPGLYGDVGLTRLFPVPPATLREVVEKLDQPELESAWTDDTTLGWVYQYWNDPEREALDAKLNDGGKIEPHEIASKTQMFTERYMVEWLLQNSLGLTWLCMCRKHGWTPDADRVLPLLDARRADWRKQRDAGEVALDALMPIEGELEEHWKYYVPQPIPDDAVASAPDSIRTLRLLDPACGSGHFLVIAFDLLAAMYREEARHRGETTSDREIAESILENNLHGIDIDPRAVQIAAAAVVLKAKRLAPDSRPKRVNLVAPVLRLGNLPSDDPALVRLRHDLKTEAGIPEELTDRLVKALAGVDHLGSLLKVDAAIDDAIREQEIADRAGAQGDLLRPARVGTFRAGDRLVEIRATLLFRLEAFLAHHAGEEDLGLRLDGEQLAAGVRFVRMAKEGTYDVVVGNPPYQGTGKMEDTKYITATYPRGKADLYGAFIERALAMVREGGYSALLTMRGWMFVGQYRELRDLILGTFRLRTLGDVDRGAFEDVPDEVLATTMAVVGRYPPCVDAAVALQPTPLSDHSRDAGRTRRKRAALLSQVGRIEFVPATFKLIAGSPLVYWWDSEFLAKYARAPKVADVAAVRQGLCTGNNTRVLRRPWEIASRRIGLQKVGDAPLGNRRFGWVPFLKGGEGRAWLEPLSEVVNWRFAGAEVKLMTVDGRQASRPQNEGYYFGGGVAFTTIGVHFAARLHRYQSIFGDMGRTVFSDDPHAICAGMNRAVAKHIVSSLAPGIHFAVSDIERLALFPLERADEVFSTVDLAFGVHEAGREASVEFGRPSASPWRYAQDWAQRAVDRPVGEPLPPYEPEYGPPAPAAFVSFAVGVALGRFGASGEGILSDPPKSALPAGILYVSAASEHDSLAHPACAPLHAAWAEHGKAVGDGDDLRTWLRTGFFKHHKTVYENRPIYFPLSSAKKSFIAWVSIHRWAPNTLTTLLADHLVPEKRRLEGELDDLRKAKTQGSKGKGGAEKRFADVQKLHEELTAFIELVEQCAERGPPPTAPDETKREQDARYEMDLDDGVMVNSSALWPLLDPQWKDPKKWWKELSTAKGKKDYDWAHLAKRYFPKRVEAKCVDDPSLAVAHGCFWRLHPAKAWAWELRLQDEIRPDFTIDEVGDEAGSDAARKKFLKEHAKEAKEAEAKEQQRRERKARKAGEEEEGNLELPLAAEGGDEGDEER
ncbi:MAG: BREX-6 system adenine-specific DNA-methyltransferase PglX [Anaeromyxobacteraceae bacterium]